MSAHVAAETQQQGADKWFDKTTWSRSIGSSLLTVAMSQARSTMVSIWALDCVQVAASRRALAVCPCLHKRCLKHGTAATVLDKMR